MRYQLIQYSIFIYAETHGDSVNEMGLVFFSKASAGYDWTYLYNLNLEFHEKSNGCWLRDRGVGLKVAK